MHNELDQHKIIEHYLSLIAPTIDNIDGVTKILLVIPESAGDVLLCTSLLSSIKEMYDPCHIYFACYQQYFPILKNNPYIYKTIEYVQIMDNTILMEGVGTWNGLFDIAIMVTAMTQRLTNYVHNGIGKIAFNLKK